MYEDLYLRYEYNDYAENYEDLKHTGIYPEELYCDSKPVDYETFLKHYGMPRRSGRYPWGSGDNPYQHSGDWLSRYESLKKEGLAETEIAEAMELSTTQLRAAHTIAVNQRRSDLVAKCKSLKQDGLSNPQIADKLGLKGESTVRSLLNADSEARMKICEKTAENLKNVVDQKGMVDIGKGVERELGISPEKFNTAVEMLRMEGYEVWGGRVPQMTNPGKYTTIKVLAKPGTPHKNIFDFEEVKTLNDYISYDNGDTFEKSFHYPESMDSKRLKIRYAEDGGIDKDGIVEIRRGCKDLNLGDGVNYAQVRILVDNTHYIKGMAVYGDDKSFPDGVDVIFNTNKNSSKSKLEVLKSIDKNIKKDPENPFGSSIKEHGGQSYYIDENGEKKLSLINKRAEEGDWSAWADKLPSQFLSKQPLKLINKQLNLSIQERENEFNEIKSLTNPTLKKSLLESYAEDCDAAAVQLKAVPLPGQRYQVILPLTTIKDTEVYAPNFEDGTKVALIRYPHGGTFEIPIVTVNNRNQEGIRVMSKNPTDAVGISKSVADRLSGADFDGDTVMVIPLNDKVQIKNSEPLKELIGFDTKLSYQYDKCVVDEHGDEHYFRGGKEFKIMNNTQTEMGIISNLITDMTLGGATRSELARAVKHSMVVIDAEKHKLDYKQSETDNKITELKKKYQAKEDGRYGGASTLISKAKSKTIVNERKEGAFFLRDGKTQVRLFDEDNNIYVNDKTGEVFNRKDVITLYVNPRTGEKLYHDTNRKYYKTEYVNSNGKKVVANAIAKDGKYYFKDESGEYVQVDPSTIKVRVATQDSTKMAEVKDARLLSSGTPQEQAYANYANRMKALANEARLEAINTEGTIYSPKAKEEYPDEVASIKEKYNQALANKPRERRAQLLANSAVKALVQDNPSLDKEDLKKIKQKELAKAREKVGAHRHEIYFTDREWAAVQAGAIAKSMFAAMIPYCDSKRLRQLATPRKQGSILSEAKVNRIKNLKNNGYTTAEIAMRLGVSSSTILKYLSGGIA